MIETSRRQRVDAVLFRVALVATLFLPPFIMYSRAIADILVSLTAILFLAHSAIRRDWQWTRQTWVRLVGLLWLLMMAASALYGSLPQALVCIRLFVLVAALQAWVLREERERRWLFIVVGVCAGWTILQCWQQYALGYNILGTPRFIDGALTGPLTQPRAGTEYLMMALPGVMPVVLTWLHRDSLKAQLAGTALLAFVLATTILIGQRMPTLLFLLGLGLTGLLVKRFRLPVILALGIGAAVLAATPIISPPTYQKLVLKFLDQIGHFQQSPYGLIYTRATVMVEAHPWLGLGFDGFRTYCLDPAYLKGLPWLGIADTANGGAGGCNIHPHNNYLQIATSAGLPALGLFVAIAVLWIRQAASALNARRDPLQVMLLVTLCVTLWPIASASNMFVFPTAGWIFLIIGWALAAGRRYQTAPV